MIKDYSLVNEYVDHVICNHCMTEMYVDCDTDVCPCCGKSGYLMDIQQEVKL